MKIIVLFSLIFMSIPSHALLPVQQPHDVQEFMQKRDNCDHFRGEEPYDGRRALEIAKNIEKYCKGTDKQLALLKKKYSKNPEALKALSVYEETVE